MHPFPSLSVLWLLPIAMMLQEDSTLDCIPRRSVGYSSQNAHLFHEEGVFNYSVMLLREDLGLLILGSKEAVFALDLNDISKKVTSVKWAVTQEQENDCKNKGKDPETECKNYIRVLHKMTDDKMYVCGTNAFDPECANMTYADGKLILEKAREDGKGKCPFDPFQRYASIMDENDLYSATSINFLGSEPVLMRSSGISVRTEFKSSWLNEPTFVALAQMPESDKSDVGDDDKVYLFFSETAVECDCYNKLLVSRVARVCKGDLGGQRTLQKKWTSFLKARLDCPVLDSRLPYIIQDTYRCDTSDLSAVCAYRVSDISKVFAEGKYKTPVTVETSFVKWVMYSGDVPKPRPGACIDNEVRKAGINQTLDLPDRTLQFVKDKPLMDQAIQPIGEKPLLVRRGAAFTCIVVNQVEAVDGKKYHVMFVGTEEGAILKAVNYNGEMFIIEQVQLFRSSEPIKLLKFSNVTGHLYAGSNYGAVQIPQANCGRSLSCMDCVLARDPYCGWDNVAQKCTAFHGTETELIQSVEDGNATLCPQSDLVKTVMKSIWPGGNLKLLCPPPSNLAKISWEQDGHPLSASLRHQLLHDGLLILNASQSIAGRYRCMAVEHSKVGEYRTTVSAYQVSIDPLTGPIAPEAQRDGPSVAGLQAAVGLLVVSLLALLAWNFCKGHIPLPWNCRDDSREQSQQGREGLNSTMIHPGTQMPVLAESNPLVSGTDNGKSNNVSDGSKLSAAEGENATLPSLQYIDDDSDI